MKKFVLFFLSFLPLCASDCSFTLSVNKENRAKIEEIVSTVAHTGLFSLLSKKRHLDTLGAEVSKEVPFLQFWGYIFSEPKLTKDMKLIQSSSFKYNPFISGGREDILKNYNKNRECFLKEVEGFALFLHLDPQKTAQIAKSSLDAFQNHKNGLKPFFDYLIKTRLTTYSP